MKKSDITAGLKAHLAGGGLGHPGRWPNVGGDGLPPARPYFEVNFASALREGSAIAGGGLVERGRMSVAIVVEVDTGTAEAEDLADDVAALFVHGQVIPITGGNIHITGPCDINPGFRDGPDWRVPVTVKYSALPA